MKCVVKHQRSKCLAELFLENWLRRLLHSYATIVATRSHSTDFTRVRCSNFSMSHVALFFAFGNLDLFLEKTVFYKFSSKYTPWESDDFDDTVKE